MMRSLHRWPGVVVAILVTVVALSGAALSVFPAYQAWTGPVSVEASVADIATRVQVRYPSVEQIRRAPSGRITAYHTEGGGAVSSIIDPETGSAVERVGTPTVQRFLTNLHRSLFLGDPGRIAVATGAAAMVVLCLSGLSMLARRAGGWRHILSRNRGTGDGRRHATVARLTVAGLLLSSTTALWMAASTFGFVPEGNGPPPFPTAVSGKMGATPGAITLLRDTPIEDLRLLSFPVAGDETDVLTLKTTEGEGYIDQGTGELLTWSDVSTFERAGEVISMLHTGRGAALLGLLLGFSALGVPILSWTGVRLMIPALRFGKRTSVPADQADTIILVGSEGGSTWAFAETLRAALEAAGARVHTSPMTSFAPGPWRKAERVILLAATHGDGDAPASARNFLERLDALSEAPKAPVAILGFGDRFYPRFCGFAQDVAEAAKAKGWAMLLSMETVDRQSPQDFARWGRSLSQALHLPFELDHEASPPATIELGLLSRRDYGADVQAPVSILRFALPKAGLWARLTGRTFPTFEAGDLIGVLPEGSTCPRFYSLASASSDGFLEICVRRQPGGLCSSQLTTLEPGQTMKAFLRPNPNFRIEAGTRPVLLIGAGTGIGPLAGFARSNTKGQPMHLFFGARHPSSDALYAEEIADWRADGRLSSVTTAYSRCTAPLYVQDALHRDAVRVARLISEGAQIMVCGGRDMAAGVASVLTDILAGQGPTIASLKAEGRYAEDVY